MKDHDEKKLEAIRAADGERPPGAVDPDLRGFLREEADAVADADALAASLRLKGTLEDEVLRRMGMKTPYRFALLLAGLAAAALVAIVFLMRDGDGTESVRRDPTARFETIAGDVARSYEERGVFHFAQGETRVEVAESTLVETGVAVVELAPGSYEIKVRHGILSVRTKEGRAVIRDGGADVVVAAGEARTYARATSAAPVGDLVLEPVASPAEGAPARLTGRVVDADNEPVADARIWVVETGIVARTGPDGGFDTEVGGAVAHVGVLATGFAPSDLRRIEPAARPVLGMDFVLVHRGGALAVKVQGPESQPVAGARVRIGALHYRDLPVRAKSSEGYPLSATRPRLFTTDAAGRVEADALPPQWNNLLVEAPGFAPYEGWVRVPPDGRETRVVKLVRGGTVTGSVVDDRATPVAEAVVGVRHPLSGRPYPGVETKTDAAGRFELRAVPPTKVEIVAVAPDGRRAAGWLEPGPTRVWTGTVRDARTLQGRVVYEDDTPAAKAFVMCSRAWRGVGAKPTNVYADEDGSFRIDGLPDALHRLRVWAPRTDYSYVMVPAKELDVLPGGDAVTIRIPRAEEIVPGALVGVVARPDGGATGRTQLHAWPMGRPGWRTSTLAEPDGSFRLGPLVPGRYKLEVHRDGQPTLHVDDVDVRKGEDHDLGTVAFPRGGRVRGRILTKDGAPWPHGTIGVQSLDQSIYYSVKKHEGGLGLSEELAPGRYLVYGGGVGVFEEVEVRPGETTDVELRMRPGRKLVLTFLLADGSAPRELSYRVRDRQGRSVYYSTLDHGENEASFWITGGDYRVSAQDGKGRSAELEVTVTAGTDPQTVPLTLR